MDIKDFNPTELDYTTGEPDYKSLWGKKQVLRPPECRVP